VLVAVNGCASYPKLPLQIFDKEVCANLGDIVYQGQHIGARCKHTLTEGVRNVPLEQWREKKAAEGGSIGLLCMNSQAFEDAETVIDQACQYVTCEYKTREAIKAAFARLRPVVAAAQKVDH
jgi:hypothetical protein